LTGLTQGPVLRQTRPGRVQFFVAVEQALVPVQAVELQAGGREAIKRTPPSTLLENDQ